MGPGHYFYFFFFGGGGNGAAGGGRTPNLCKLEIRDCLKLTWGFLELAGDLVNHINVSANQRKSATKLYLFTLKMTGPTRG